MQPALLSDEHTRPGAVLRGTASCLSDRRHALYRDRRDAEPAAVGPEGGGPRNLFAQPATAAARRAGLLRSAAQLHVDGYPLHWSALAPAPRHSSSELPSYPFSHRAYWLAESPVVAPTRSPAHARRSPARRAQPRPSPPSPSLPAELLALSPAERESRVQAHLTGWVRKTLGLPTFQVPEPSACCANRDWTLLMSHELSRSIDQALRITLPAGRILAHGSIAA